MGVHTETRTRLPQFLRPGQLGGSYVAPVTTDSVVWDNARAAALELASFFHRIMTLSICIVSACVDVVIDKCLTLSPLSGSM